RMRGPAAWRMRHAGQAIMIAWRAAHGSGGCRPPPPFAAPLRCALTPAATPRCTWGVNALDHYEAFVSAEPRSQRVHATLRTRSPLERTEQWTPLRWPQAIHAGGAAGRSDRRERLAAGGAAPPSLP